MSPGDVKPPVIHRDGTFTYRRRRYVVGQGSPRPERDGSRFIARILSDEPGDQEVVEDTFGWLSDVRAFLADATARGHEYLSARDAELDGAQAPTSASGYRL